MTDVVALLEPLIRHRTDAGRGNEPALARHLSEALRHHNPDELVSSIVPREPPVPDGAYVYARWGRPSLLLNVHLDTVPPNDGWTADPFTPRVADGRIIGLGAADTKGAIAAILGAMADEAPTNVAVLFSGDEERRGRCIESFLMSELARGLKQAIVCEPTRCLAGTRHRGVLALEIDVKAQGGHSSRADAMRSPIAELSRLAVAYDTWGRSHRTKGPPGFTGMCVNLAKMEGGVAFNMVPAQATLCVSFRCPPDANPRLVRAELEAIAHGLIPDAIIRAPVDHAPFHTRELEAFEPWLGDIARAPIDLGYWTEAALMSAAGIDAVVFGPGDIAQAHAADEWVEIEQLERARRIFAGVFRGTRARAGTSDIHGIS